MKTKKHPPQKKTQKQPPVTVTKGDRQADRQAVRDTTTHTAMCFSFCGLFGAPLTANYLLFTAGSVRDPLFLFAV